MSREVCGICWCPYDEDTGECACVPEPNAPPQRKPLTEEEIRRIDASTHFHESPDWSLRFARAIEAKHGIL